jgi:hypothetical protein
MFKTYTYEDYKMVVDGKEHISTPEQDSTIALFVCVAVAFSSLFVSVINLI